MPLRPPRHHHGIPPAGRRPAWAIAIAVLAAAMPATSTIAADGAVARPAPAAAVPAPPARSTPTATATLVEPDRLPALRIATLNAEHLMSLEGWQAWRAWCEPRGWQDGGRAPGGGIPDGRMDAPPRPAGIAYCNALDGTDGRGRRLSAPLRDAGAWRDKADQLAAALRRADADVLLLQEVADPAAVRSIVGPGYRIAVSDAAGTHQQVAIAWRQNLDAQAAEPLDGLAVAGRDGRRSRPGLALRLRVAPQRTLTLLNLHLKAGCRQGRLDAPLSRRPERRFRRAEACGIFQRQVPALASWIDRERAAGHAVLVGGDFNRDLRRETKARMPAQRDGRDPAGPAEPAPVTGLLAELNRGRHQDATVRLVPSGPYRRLADCHRHIDAFLLDGRLAAWTTAAPRTEVLPWPAPVHLDRVRPTDHCVHRLVLRF